MSWAVLGQGAWMPNRVGVSGVLAEFASDDGERPDLTGYPSRLMRGTSTLTRMCAAVARQALHASGADGATIPAVFASANGELNIAIDQLTMMVTGDGKISPARFKNSVHNTSAGIFSIAHGNKGMTTSLAGGPLTVAHALLEAFGILDDGGSQVLVVVGDESLPEPLSQLKQWPSFAAAWVLGREAPDDGTPRARLSGLSATPADTPVPASLPDGLQHHPCVPGYHLMAAIDRAEREASAGSKRLGLGSDDDEFWSVAVGR